MLRSLPMQVYRALSSAKTSATQNWPPKTISQAQNRIGPPKP